MKNITNNNFCYVYNFCICSHNVPAINGDQLKTFVQKYFLAKLVI